MFRINHILKPTGGTQFLRPQSRKNLGDVRRKSVPPAVETAKKAPVGGIDFPLLFKTEFRLPSKSEKKRKRQGNKGLPVIENAKKGWQKN